MSIANTRPMNRRPTHPGEMLWDASAAIKVEVAHIKPLQVA
jgi:hypothetical protein